MMKLPPALMLVPLVAALVGGRAPSAAAKEPPDDSYSKIETFIQVFTKVRDHYVDPVNLDTLMTAAIRGMAQHCDPSLSEAEIQGSPSAKPKKASDQDYARIERFVKAFGKLRDHCPGSTAETLVDDAIRGMLRSLDSGSDYLDPETARGLAPQAAGPSAGVGLSIGIRDKWVTVLAPVDGGPAWRAGVLPGDRIIAIDGVSSQGLSSNEALKKILGEKGSTVGLRIRREGHEKPLEFTIIRDIIVSKNVMYAGVLANGVGYILLSRFADGSNDEIVGALARLEKQKLNGLILDLRFNPGGHLTQAVEVSEAFVPRDKMIFYTKGRDPSQNRDFRSTAKEAHTGYPLIVLVGPLTSSASEIIAGAVQDLDLGVVVGRRTFGSGMIQTVIPLTRSVQGPKLKLTTARWYTPAGRCVQTATAGASLAASGSETALREYKTTTGRPVFSGSGICPDLELDAVHVPPIVGELEASQVFTKYAGSYAAAHESAPTTYTITSQMRVEFEALLKSENPAYSADSLAAVSHWVDARLRRELARRYAGDEAAYRVAVEDDEQVTAAAALVDKAPTLPELFTLVSQMNRVPGK